MSLNLSPRESFTIVRQIEDHTDTGTYYVQAVIRNAKTDATIETLNLTDQGSLRFTKNWQVPADASGQGLWVSILTSVYTDSGYTTKSQNYGDKMEIYLIQERYVFNPNYPMPTGPDIDYKRIKKMIVEAVKDIEFPEQKTVEQTEIDFLTPLLALKEEVRTMVDAIPQPEKVSPTLKRIEMTLATITKTCTDIEKNSTPEVSKELLSQKLDELMALIKQSMIDLKKELSDEIVPLKNTVKEISEIPSTLSEKISGIEFNVPLQMKMKEDKNGSAKPSYEPRVASLMKK